MKRVRPTQGGSQLSPKLVRAAEIRFGSGQNGFTIAKITIPIISTVGISLTIR
jgi:hypothetical protein